MLTRINGAGRGSRSTALPSEDVLAVALIHVMFIRNPCLQSPSHILMCGLPVYFNLYNLIILWHVV